MLQDEMHSARWFLDEYWPGQPAASREIDVLAEFQHEDSWSIGNIRPTNNNVAESG
jgi:hypothetical protein